MALVNGTAGNDTLRGTGHDTLAGGEGADVYAPYPYAVAPAYVIADGGTDGAVDTLLGNLFYGRRYIDLDTYSPSDYMGLGYAGRAGWALAERVGDDLVFTLPAKPSAFRVTGHAALTVVLDGQYAPGGNVEQFQWGTRLFTILQGTAGTAAGDLFAGTTLSEVVRLRAGDNIAWGNGGDDRIIAGAGADTAFGGDGNDRLSLGDGTNTGFGGAGADLMVSGTGADQMFGADGNDTIRSGGGNDWVDGERGNDVIDTGAGQDQVTGGGGDDTLTGGADGDTYQFDDAKVGAETGWGHDTLRDGGGTGEDILDFWGFYGPSYTGAPAADRISLDRDGDNAILLIDGGAMSITLDGQCDPASGANVIETLRFFAGYWTPWTMAFRSAGRDDIGDERAMGSGNEIIWGSDGDDQVFSDAGLNIIWLGAGADTLIYKESDPSTALWTSGGGDVADRVVDFDLAEDRMDFTEIRTLGMDDLTLGQNAAGNATIGWLSGSIEVSNIWIELRGVALADLTADHFVFF